MAFSFANGGNGRGRFRGGYALSEMNVIPLVDVVLVLLIIFMLTAHVMEFGLEVEVPKVRQVRDTAQELPVVTLTRTGEIYLNDKPANINLLGQLIHERFPTMKAVYLRADKGTVWDGMAQVISRLGEANYQVMVVTQPEEETARR
ncbi:MAG: biopolymer transporter ExbD [Acidobacteria bacterium]|nr:biopolymer transporter ExbD [Acidobacteriota bacterium]MBI3280614.1 biopolymer transporter ExbD [Acidobacteriota bacterium]